jgi:RHS repeat-associated protein
MSATFEYEYDRVGNMSAYTTTITSTVVVTREFDNANRLTKSNDGSGDTNYLYDDNGNLVKITPPGGSGETAYGFNQRNLLITSTFDSGGGHTPVAEFFYDGDGNRLGQVDYTGATTTTITYTNDIIGLVQVLVADDGTEKIYNHFGLDLILQDDGATDLVLMADGLGSVRTEMMGASVETVSSYTPYGELLSRSGASGTDYGFTGELRDNSTGLLYLRARYYYPTLHSFMSVDPAAAEPVTPQSINVYDYSLNNPVKFIDPSGQTPRELLNSGCAQIPISPPGPILPLRRSLVQIYLRLLGEHEFSKHRLGTIIDSNAVLTHDHLIPSFKGIDEVEKIKITDSGSEIPRLNPAEKSTFKIVEGSELGANHGALSVIVFQKHFSTDSEAESLGELIAERQDEEYALQAVVVGALPGLYLTRIEKARPGTFRNSAGQEFHGIRVFPDYTVGFDSGAPLFVGGVVRAVNLAGPKNNAGPGIYGAVSDLSRIRSLIHYYSNLLSKPS